MSLTIVMYHYVRDLARTRYPGIKGRDVAAFRGQLDYIAHHYTVVTADRVVAALKGGEELPANAIWLTFDDGYKDHYTVVFPLLQERGWQGSFFPPVRVVQNGELLDVNRIHFILAEQANPAPLLDAIRDFVIAHRGEAMVCAYDDYWRQFARASRLDTAEVTFIKRMLQHALPEVLRRELAERLFARFVAVDPAVFAAELYMTPEQLRTMIRCGMHVGSHGVGHYWLDRLDAASQAAEIDASLDFLGAAGASVKDWVMCYPYGSYDESLLSLLKNRRCAAGLTTKTAVARLDMDDPLTLPRLDTNDIPVRF
jgi:peptidoglycan/xylan/chitin deacetylase (PgdA/CDA1 family)